MTQSEIINNNFSKAFECIKCSNGYETGASSSEEKLFKQINERKCSTFDKSKFTIVGSPNITDEGNYSCLTSTSDYIGTASNITLTNDSLFSITLAADLRGNTGNGWLFRNGYTASNLCLWTDGTEKSLSFHFGQIEIKSLTIAYDSVYKITLSRISTDTYKICVYDTLNSIEIANESVTTTSTPDLTTNDINIQLGYTSVASSTSCLIDLSKFSVKVDGKEVFSGNKTGLDVIKPDNYEVVGSPVISEDGVASGFSSANYLRTIQLSQLKDKSWDIEGTFYHNMLSGNISLLGLTPTYAVRGSVFYKTNALIFSVFIGTTGDLTSEGEKIRLSIPFSEGYYKFKLSFNYGISTYTLSVYDTNGTLLQTGNYIPPTNNKQLYDININPTTPITIGRRSSGLTSDLASTDLNAFKIYVDGDLVYQPCLKIPYTESKTGSKIVNSTYRDRVIDLYEQTGKAEYYTIDEENQNFTLPMGEIYGMIEETKQEIHDLDNKKQDIIPDLETIRNNAQLGLTAIQEETDPLYTADKPNLALKTEIPDISNLATKDEISLKQDKLTAGDGIKIENNVISTESTKILTDNNTIIQNEDSTITSIATKTKSNTIKIDWEGTNAEYEAGIADGSISSDWYCYITDDEVMVDFNDFANNSLSNLSEAGQAIVDYKASIDLDNLSEVGEKHFLNKSQITNCLTEVPQRIKYTLENGTLTIKAGSVVIVPYGTEDLTSQYPKGSTFINDNFKVYDTQFGDGKFFVWAELLYNIGIKSDSTWGTAESGSILMSCFNGYFRSVGLSRLSSGTTAPTETNGRVWYDTTENYVKVFAGGIQVDGGSAPVSLPLMITTLPGDSTTTITSVNQVFNGFGYIGSTIWVDKNVKGLFSYDRFNDGTIANIQWANPSLFTSTFPDTLSVPKNLFIKLQEVNPNSQIKEIAYWSQNQMYSSVSTPVTPASSVYALWHNPDNQQWQETLNGSAWEDVLILEFGKGTFNNGIINTLTTKYVFQAADIQNVDGTWISKLLSLASNVTLTGGSTLTYDLSSYLPNDGYDYEVQGYGMGFTGSSTGDSVDMYVTTDIQPYGLRFAGATTRTNYNVRWAGGFSYPVGAGRQIAISNFITTSNAKISLFRIVGYRRLGQFN